MLSQKLALGETRIFKSKRSSAQKVIEDHTLSTREGFTIKSNDRVNLSSTAGETREFIVLKIVANIVILVPKNRPQPNLATVDLFFWAYERMTKKLFQP